MKKKDFKIGDCVKAYGGHVWYIDEVGEEGAAHSGMPYDFILMPEEDYKEGELFFIPFYALAEDLELVV